MLTNKSTTVEIGDITQNLSPLYFRATNISRGSFMKDNQIPFGHLHPENCRKSPRNLPVKGLKFI